MGTKWQYQLPPFRAAEASGGGSQVTGDGRTKGWPDITSDKKHVPWSQVSGFEFRLCCAPAV